MADLDPIHVPLQPDSATGYFCAMRHDDVGPPHRLATGWRQVQGCAGPTHSLCLRVILANASTATCLTGSINVRKSLSRPSLYSRHWEQDRANRTGWDFRVHPVL